MTVGQLLDAPGSAWLAGVALLVAGVFVAWLYYRGEVRRRRELERELDSARRELDQNELVLSEVNDELTRIVVDRDRKARWLTEAKVRAEAASQAKGRFLASMSHELRTPLNSVIGFANQLLKNKEGHFSERDLLYLRRIAENGEHLLGLIDRILNMASVDAGRLQTEMVSTSLDTVVREVVEELERHTPQGKVSLSATVPDGVEPLVTDPGKLKQVLIHLVANGIRFTERGGVTVTVRADGRLHPLWVEVTDDGIGIPAERIETIFEPFEQVSQDTSRTHEGTGLGLALCRSLCDAMGYGLEVESELGAGSTFRVTFPVEPHTREDASSEKPVESSPDADRIQA